MNDALRKKLLEMFLPAAFFVKHETSYAQRSVGSPGWTWSCKCDDEKYEWFAGRDQCIEKTHEHWSEEIDKEFNRQVTKIISDL